MICTSFLLERSVILGYGINCFKERGVDLRFFRLNKKVSSAIYEELLDWSPKEFRMA